jgi:hypothetical protein
MAPESGVGQGLPGKKKKREHGPDSWGKLTAPWADVALPQPAPPTPRKKRQHPVRSGAPTISPTVQEQGAASTKTVKKKKRERGDDFGGALLASASSGDGPPVLKKKERETLNHSGSASTLAITPSGAEEGAAVPGRKKKRRHRVDSSSSPVRSLARASSGAVPWKEGKERRESGGDAAGAANVDRGRNLHWTVDAPVRQRLRSRYVAVT